MIRAIIICLLSFTLLACAVKSPAVHATVGISNLRLGKHYFDLGYYKRAMERLLPLACEGLPDAEYAVGYMYYYGLGVAQDTEVGYFWIKRAADKRYITAIRALDKMHPRGDVVRRPLKKYKL